MPFAKDIINQVAKTPKAAALQHCSTGQSCMTCSACHVLQPELQRLQNNFKNSKNWRIDGFNFVLVVLHTRTFHYVQFHCTLHCVKQNRKTHLTYAANLHLQDAFFVHTRLRFLHHNSQTKSIFRNTFLWFVSKKSDFLPQKNHCFGPIFNRIFCSKQRFVETFSEKNYWKGGVLPLPLNELIPWLLLLTVH